MGVIKPCPFCGHEGVTVVEASTFRWRVAMCDNCGAQAGEVRHDTLDENQPRAEMYSRQEAINVWNERSEK